MIDTFRDLKDYKRAKRLIWGVPCMVCREKLPKANAKILEPGQLCRAHKPFYRDPRPEPTDEEFDARMAAHGWPLCDCPVCASDVAGIVPCQKKDEI